MKPIQSIKEYVGDDGDFDIIVIFQGIIRAEDMNSVLIENDLPAEGTRCHHPYDCCGNYYHSAPEVSYVDDQTKVVWRYRINI